MKIISIRKNPQWAEKAKAYCKEKWSDVYGPFEAALNQCLQKENGLPETWLMLGGMQQDEIKGVYQLCDTEHVETVVLLSHKKPDSHINIKVEFGEGEGIETKYGFKVHTAYIAEVKRSLGLPMYDAPNAVEELKHPTAEKVEAIKDALKYFGVI